MNTAAKPHLLQVCNVGRATGGTGACVETVIRALPAFTHEVVVLGPVDPEFARHLAPAAVRRECSGAADVILLHNTPRSARLKLSSAPTVQYLHSKIDPHPAAVTVYCSRWLAKGYGAATDRILYQAVPRPPQPAGSEHARHRREQLIVGRFCTPTARKWPPSLAGFYAELAAQHPRVHWEFVGCPGPLQAKLQAACRDRATFHEPGITARRHLWTWDALLYYHPDLTESFGRVVAESMRAACVPIVDNRGGFCEQIIPGSGFLCRDTAEFSAALHTLADLPRRTRYAETAHRHADRTFDLTTFAHRLLTTFDAARAKG